MAMSAANADAKLTADLVSGTPHIQLHTGSPGVVGTANIAVVDTTADAPRRPASFDSPANHPTEDRRMVTSDEDIVWSSTQLDASQELTHFSIWPALSTGTVLYVESLSASKITGSDGARIDSGDLNVQIGVFAKP